MSRKNHLGQQFRIYFRYESPLQSTQQTDNNNCSVLARFYKICAFQAGEINGSLRLIDKGRLRKLVFSRFRTDGSSYHQRTLAMTTLYSPLDFNIVADEEVGFGII